MARELARSINGFLEGLNARSREIFLRRYYGSEKVKEMAAAMALSTSTVEKELKALRLDLKKKLESEGKVILPIVPEGCIHNAHIFHLYI